ncbi:MAG TPA: sulfotransferase [Anaerolineales bacterium]
MTGKPILVTGAHRTGTTWVGRMLAANPATAYISEPLNVLHRPGVMRARVVHWYTYINQENEAEYLPSLMETLRYRYHLPAELLSLRSGHDFLRMCRDVSIFLRGGLFHLRPLLKDPFAVFSLPWFVQRLGCEVVVTVRHPAGFASSLKRLNWPFDFRDLLAQPLLMRDQLEPYRGRMESMPDDDIIGQASLLWAMIYGSVQTVCRELPAVRVVRHEDLSIDPVPGFRDLYGELGLAFTPGVERRILDSSSAENPAELSRKRVHSTRLDSRANLHNWKRRLSAEEVARIRQLTEEVARDYYPEVDWN